MMSDWPIVPLSSIASYSQGIQVPVEEQETIKKMGFVRFVRIIDFTNPSEPPRYIKSQSKKYFVDDNELVMIRYGSQTAGKIVRGISGFIANNMFKVSINSDVADNSYVYRYLSSEYVFNYLRGNQSSSTMPAITFGMMDTIKIHLPPKTVQTEIAGFFDVLDKRITLLRETNKTLEAIAQAIFKSWFVDFDPVRAKQEGREPEGMDADTAALFPDSFEESELGLIPKRWRVGTLADLAKLNPESWTAKAHPEMLKYIDLANAKNNDIDVITEYAFDEAPSRARRVLRDGDSIIGTVRPGNRSFAYIYQAPSNLTGSTGFAVLRPKNAENSEFLFIAATQNSSIDHLSHVADGGAYPAVRPEVVKNIQTVLPNADVLKNFHEIVEPLFSLEGENKLKAQTLTQLRDTLLPRLISGQLRLPDIKIFEEMS